jgi:hypothetical protein
VYQIVCETPLAVAHDEPRHTPQFYEQILLTRPASDPSPQNKNDIVPEVRLCYFGNE